MTAENDARRERALRAASVPPESGDEDFDALATRQLLAAMDRVLPPGQGNADA